MYPVLCYAVVSVETFFIQGKVFTLEQATKAQRGSRRIAVLFPYPWHYMGVGGQRHAPAALPFGKDLVPIV
jgi:hypothetical protein